MKWMLRIIMVLITVSLFIVCVATFIRGCQNKPVKFGWGLYENRNTDTIIKEIQSITHDTITVSSKENGKLNDKSLNDKIHVESHNQKGGQTAGSIVNKH